MQYLYRNKSAVPLMVPGVGHPIAGDVVVTGHIMNNPNFELVKTTDEKFSQEEIEAERTNPTPSPTLPNSVQNPDSEAKNEETQENSGVGEGA